MCCVTDQEGPKIQEDDADELRQIAKEILVSSERLERVIQRTPPGMMKLKMDRARTSIQLSVCDIHQYCHPR